METKIFTDEVEATEFVKELSENDNTVDVFKNKDGGYKINWVANKKYIAQDGKEFTDEVWTTIDGRMIHIQDLEPEHAKNIIRMMLRNSRQMQQESAAMLEQLADAISGMLENDGSVEDTSEKRILH